MADSMRAGYYQFDLGFADKQANLRKVERALAGCDLDLVVLPELFSTGCLFTSRQQALGLAETVPDGETTRHLIRIARRARAGIVAGLLEVEDGRLYNTAVIVTPEGYLGKHRKVHLPGTETGLFNPGHGFQAFDFLGVRIGILLCYDSWFPEAGRALAAQGVSLICNPSNFCGEDSLVVIRQRAVETAAYTITANRLGMDHDTGTGVAFIGASCMVSPVGDVMHHAGDREAVGGRQLVLDTASAKVDRNRVIS